jgi:hypothetical protein
VRTFNNRVGEERKQASERRGEDDEKQEGKMEKEGWMTEVGWGEERRPITRTIESLRNGVSVHA